MKYKCSCTVHVYNGISTSVQNEVLDIEAENTDNAKLKLTSAIQNKYRKLSHISLSSITDISVKEFPMNKLESIKERLKNIQTDHKNTGAEMDAEHEFETNAQEDIEYLLKRLARYEKALKHVRDYERLEENWEVAKVIDEALKE